MRQFFRGSKKNSVPRVRQSTAGELLRGWGDKPRTRKKSLEFLSDRRGKIQAETSLTPRAFYRRALEMGWLTKDDDGHIHVTV